MRTSLTKSEDVYTITSKFEDNLWQNERSLCAIKCHRETFRERNLDWFHSNG